MLVVYDICNKKSFENVPTWILEAKSHIEPHRAAFILVGCKSDLTEKREVSSEEANSFAEFNEMGFIETSAKTGQHLKNHIYCNSNHCSELILHHLFSKNIM